MFVLACHWNWAINKHCGVVAVDKRRPYSISENAVYLDLHLLFDNTCNNNGLLRRSSATAEIACVGGHYAIQCHWFWYQPKVHMQLTLVVILRVPTHPWKSLKFFLPNSRPWKYLKTGQVLESPWIHQVWLCNISSSVEQVFCRKQDLRIVVTFCYYQLKLSRNHRNR